MRAYRYTVDRDGRIFHDGSEITDGAVLRFFLLAMQPSADGRYVAMCQGERNDFDASDTPFVVQRLRLAAAGTAIELFFAGDYHEPLDPSTLEDEDGRLYCRVRRGPSAPASAASPYSSSALIWTSGKAAFTCIWGARATRSTGLRQRTQARRRRFEIGGNALYGPGSD